MQASEFFQDSEKVNSVCLILGARLFEPQARHSCTQHQSRAAQVRSQACNNYLPGPMMPSSRPWCLRAVCTVLESESFGCMLLLVHAVSGENQRLHQNT